MSAEKRPAEDFGSNQLVVKRTNRRDSTQLAIKNGAGNGALIQAQPRTSGLQAPVMELTGHSGEVFAAKFNPEGNYIASGSMDRSISTYASSRFHEHLADNIKCYGGPTETAKTTEYSTDTRAPSSIYIGRATRECCSLRLQICTWPRGTLKQD